ncbi:MAG: cellulase family glycosylhydrolase [Candidatus Spechtbacterales bacterium]
MKPVKRKIIKIFFGILLFTYTVLVLLYGFFFLGSVEPASEITWGVTFGHSQADDLGLNWQETYTALLDDMGVRNFRIPIYWDELEKERGQFDFSKWDWQLRELEKRGGKAILVVGFKQPRWPECRFPDWYNHDASQLEKDAWLFQMIRNVVAYYRDNPVVWAWQVENEPLLKFGVCPKEDPSLLDAEIKLVRTLDPSRPIIITDTGEWSVWYEAGKRADILGSTLYRVIHDPLVGFVRYDFLNPTFYARKAEILHFWRPNVRVLISELQAEPWVADPPISKNSLEEQYKTLNPEQFRANMEFARRTGFDEFYLWGAEWFVWLREQGETEIWNEAQKLFAE